MKKIQIIILLLFVLIGKAFGQDDLRLTTSDTPMFKSFIGDTYVVSVYLATLGGNYKVKVVSKGSGQVVQNIDIQTATTQQIYFAKDKYVVFYSVSSAKIDVIEITTAIIRTFPLNSYESMGTDPKVIGNEFYFLTRFNSDARYTKIDLVSFQVTNSIPISDDSFSYFAPGYTIKPLGEITSIGGYIALVTGFTPYITIFRNGFTSEPTVYDLRNYLPWLGSIPLQTVNPFAIAFNGVNNSKIYLFDAYTSKAVSIDAFLNIQNFTYNRDFVAGEPLYIFSQLQSGPYSYNNNAHSNSDEMILISDGFNQSVAKVNTSTGQIIFRKIDSKLLIPNDYLIAHAYAYPAQRASSVYNSEMILAFDTGNNLSVADVQKSVLVRGNTIVSLTSNLPSTDVTLTGAGAASYDTAREINVATSLPNKYFNRWVNLLDNTTFSTVANITDWYPILDVSLQAEYVDGFTAQILPSIGGSVSGFEGLAPIGSTEVYTATASAHYSFSYFEVTANGVMISQPNQAPYNVSPYSITPASSYSIKGIFTEHPNKIMTLTNDNTTYQVNSQAVTTVKLYENDSVVISVTSTNGKTIVGLYDLDGNIYWGTNITFNYSTIPGNVILYPLYPAVTNKTLTLEFNDQLISTFVNGSTLFYDTTDPNNKILVPQLGFGTNETNKMQFSYNGFGGTALDIKGISNSTFYLKGPDLYNFGDKFAFESHFKLEEASDGDIVFFSDDLCTCFEFKLSTNGEFSLHLHNDQNGSIELTTTNAAITPGQWASVGLKIDLSKQTLNEIVTIYKNKVALTLNATEFDASFTTGTAILKRRARPTRLLSFSNSKKFMIDDMIFYLNQSQSNVDGFPLNFKGGEKEVNVQPGASGSVYIFNDFLKPIQNKMTSGDLPNGVTMVNLLPNGVVEDSVANQPGVFHGVFQFKLGLELIKFDGDLIIDYFIKRPEDAQFKKIGQKSFSKPTGVITKWDTYFYWDSKKALFDWTTDDTKPYKSTGPVQFKFELR